MKVTTENFQILKGKNIFEFPVGITVIQGPSGNGKSTIIYALQDCLSNPSGVDDVINWDAKSAKVTIENNDSSVTWIRKKGGSEYINNKTGESFVKVSKLDSRDIADLGFYFDSKGKVVNIHDEWSVLFPFGSSDTEMFKLFEDIFNVSSSFVIIEEIKEDEKNIKSDISENNKEINKYKQQKLQIEDILEKVDVNKIQPLIDNLTILFNNISEYKDSFDVYNHYYPIQNITVPKEFDTKQLSNSVSRYSEIVSDYNEYLNHLALKDIVLPEEKTFDIPTNTYRSDYNTYSKLLADISNYNTELKQLNLLEQTLQEKMSSIKVCPTCGRPLED